MTQNERILNYLKQGHTLTNLQAMVILEVGNLHARISELRRSEELIKSGYEIITEMKPNRNGGMHGVYKLVKVEKQDG